MKTKQIFLTFLIPLVGAISQVASAAVILDDAVIGPLFPGDDRKVLYLSKSIPSGSGLFAIEIETVSPSQYLFRYAGIAEEYGLFMAAPGTVFDPTFALLNAPIVSNHGIYARSSTQVFALNESRYFAYWDEGFPWNNVPDSNDKYGWVHITRTTSGLVASSGATAIGGGIIVGTSTQVPEPASLTLIAFGALLITMRRAFRNDRNG